MILKKQVYQHDKKANPFIGVLLFIISIILFAITAPFGFVYGLLHKFVSKGITGIGEFCLKIAISVDQLGNVLMQHFLNVLWIKKEGYKFGNRDETISSALGRNNKLGTLTAFGKAIDKLLDMIDPDHSLNSIDYYIEPTEAIIDKLGWIHLVDARILCMRSRKKKNYYIPGGKRRMGESDALALLWKIKQTVSVTLEVSSLEFIGIFEAQASGHKPGTFVRMTCYSGSYQGDLLPNSEISEIVWLNYKDRELVSQVDQLIFDFLKEKGELD